MADVASMQDNAEHETSEVSWRWAILGGAAWALVAVLTLGADRFPTWDEAVYWSKAAGGAPPILWLDHRSLGMPAILSPVTLLTDNFVIGRLWVAGVLGSVVACGLRGWSLTQRRAALSGALFFLLSWPALFHATEFFPNLPVGMLLWAALGSTWGFVVTRRREALYLAIVMQFCAVVIRPADAVWAGVGIVAVVIIDPSLRKHAREIVGILGGSSAAGLVPWLIESFLMFGGPINRAQGSKELFDAFTIEDPIEDFHRGLADGPTLPDPSSFDLTMAMVWAIGMLTLGFSGALLARHNEAGARLAYGAGIVGGAVYLLFPLIPDPRMLLPSVALLSVPVGQVLARLFSKAAGAVVVSICVVVFAGWSIRQGQGVVDQEVGATSDLLALADAIVADSGGDSCVVESRYGFPQMELRTGCRGSRTTDLVASTSRPPSESQAKTAYVVWLGLVEPPEGWELINYGPTLREWSILRRGS